MPPTDRITAAAADQWALPVAGMIVTGVSVAFLPVTALAVLVFALASVILLSRLDVWQASVALLVFSLVAKSSSVEALRSLPDVFRFGCLGLLLAHLVLQGRPPCTTAFPKLQRVRAACEGAVMFLLIAGVSAVWSADAGQAASQSVALAMTGLCVILTATRRWSKQGALSKDLRVIICILTVCSAVSLLGALARGSFAYGYGGRYTGLFLSATSTGMVAALTIPIAWGLKRATVPPRHRWAYWLAISVSSFTLVVSGSRGSILALCGGVAWMAWRSGSTQVVRVAAVVSIALIVGFSAQTTLGVQTPLGRVVDKFTPAAEKDYSTSRLGAWDVAFDRWKAQPILGYGFRQTEHLFQEERIGRRLDFRPDTTHNGFLEIALELGLVGLGVFAVTIVGLLRLTGGARGPLELGLFSTVLIGLLLQFTESPIFGTGSIFPFVFWSFVAASVAATRFSVRPPGRAANSLGRTHFRPVCSVSVGVPNPAEP